MREYPITKFWYGKGARFPSIEKLIEEDVDYFLWAVGRFQNVTPSQANHFKSVYGLELPPHVVEDVPPYEFCKGDPEDLYMKLCEQPRPNLESVLQSFRLGRS